MTKRTAVIWSAKWMLLALLLTAMAVGHAADKQSSTQTLMSLSGLNEQLDALPGAVRSNFDQLLTDDGFAEPFERADFPQLKQAVGAVFNADALKSPILTELETKLTADDRAMINRFYLSDTGAELRRAERDNSLLENAGRFQQWYQATGLRGLAVERQQAIEELELAMQAAKGAVDAMIGMQLAMQVSLSPVLPAAERLSIAQLQAAAERLRPGLTALYYESSLETLAFVFQDQSLDDLQAYSTLLNTVAGQRFVHAVNDGLSRGLFLAAEKLGVSLQEMVAGRIGQGA